MMQRGGTRECPKCGRKVVVLECHERGVLIQQYENHFDMTGARRRRCVGSGADMVNEAVVYAQAARGSPARAYPKCKW